MRLWRLYRQVHGPGLDGAGGRYAPGRWHSQGKPIVYFGETAAIVVLEKLAHLNPDVLPADLMLGLFEGELSIRDAWSADLKAQIDLADNIEATRAIGDEWLEARTTCVLRVPSIVVPEEFNLVFNPQHPDAAKLSLVRERRFTFDDRLL
jgi:RES domain-containing protein